jgi:putative transposase
MLASKNGSSAKTLAAQPGDASPCRELERRFKLSTNHTLAQQILDTHPHAFLGLEDLTVLRARTKRKQGKRASKKQRRANHHASKGAFVELRGLLSSKAALADSGCIRVVADYTSQGCPRCGQTRRANRPERGLLFVGSAVPVHPAC